MSAALYARSAFRVARRGRGLGTEERLVFVVGSPRSGTTFTARALGSLPGFVDLDEVQPWKAAIPGLIGQPEDEVAARLRRILERVRTLGLARGLRGVEQTPETSFVLAAALDAYPEAVAVHVIRDGRDVVTSLLERGWLSAERTGADDARLPFGAHPRFWVEPGRAEEFSRVSDATRAAWAWRRYVTAAEAVPGAHGSAALRAARVGPRRCRRAGGIEARRRRRAPLPRRSPGRTTRRRAAGDAI